MTTTPRARTAAPTTPEGQGPIDGDLLLVELAEAIHQVRRGRFDVRLSRRDGPAGDVVDQFNELVSLHERRTRDLLRISRVVGRGGRMTDRLDEESYDGAWTEGARAVNVLIDDLARPTAEIARVIEAVAEGDLSQHMALEIEGRPLRGEFRRIGRTVNTMVDQLSSFADEVTRVAREVGTDGRLGGQADVRGVAGTWRALTDSVNTMASNLTNQVRSISSAATAIAQGDLSRKITVSARGEVAELADTINSLTDTLRLFADEVTRVAREVGTDGRLGGQAAVPNVAGTWKNLTDAVNLMAANLTDQVRGIAQVATAVATGDLSQNITVDARGEILELKNTVNTMVDQLSSFADEVTRVAREVGTEGKLGGQAQVRGVSGTWRHLTENVNQLASTLTTQLRAISAVSTSVASGDLTQQIRVAALGEVAELKDNINQMIVALRETTKENADQGWLDSNLARIGGLLQGQRDLGEVCQMIMGEVAPLVNAQIGAFFLAVDSAGGISAAGATGPRWVMCGGYAVTPGNPPLSFRIGEGLIGQAAATKQTVLVDAVPSDYLLIRSGIGSSAPRAVVVLPVQFEDESLGVIEFGSVAPFSELHLMFLERLVGTIGVAITTIQANRRTEELLAQSQGLAMELQDQSAELQRTNNELEEKAAQLFEQNRNIEIKNMEIDAARRGVEEKAQQLALASQYKSEFLANMSHELRTPLNSLLLLSRLLADNPDSNLSPKQIDFASTIHDAGSELLSLIDDILDLSKIEAGRVDVDAGPVDLAQVRGYVEQAFGPQAEDKGLELRVEAGPGAPELITTDAQRLQQILRNLLSNAVKFTDSGSVTLRIGPAAPALYGVPTLDGARSVVSFAVRDTGIGIPDEKFAMIFEAFQQADGTTSRKYGGTGLGLSISKELAQMLGGSITVSSELGAGSEFTLFLPDELPVVTAASAWMTSRHAIGAPPPERPARGTPILRTAAGGAGVSGARHELTGATVLIVDDDVRNVFALTSALELHGLTVLYADNGMEGIRLLTEHPEVDIVLMDAMMPDLDGNETTGRIRALPQGGELPVVFLTAKAMPGDRESSLAAGATDYVTKPVDLDELLVLMASWVNRGAGVPDAGRRL